MNRSMQYVAGVIAIALCVACAPSPPPYKGSDLSRVDWGRDFALTAHTGKPVSTTEFRGKVVALFFGYTHCPDICAPTLAKLAALRKSLGADADKLQVLFVSVDPAHDTPKALARFVVQFDPSFIGLTGKPDEIAAVTREYKIAVATSHAAAHAMIEHAGNVLVKDTDGKLRLMFKNDASVADMAHDVRLLLKKT